MPSEPFNKGAVSGYLHRPVESGADGLVLTHGAGGDCRMPLLVAVADAFTAAGFTVLRVDLAFRQKRSHGPPSPHGAASDRAGLREALHLMREIVSGQTFIGGQSYGGRQASILASEAPDELDGLLLLSYPLHPPGKPEQLRTAHFPLIKAPALFVHGSTDPFGTNEELRTAISLIRAPAEILEIEKAGHDLARGKFDVAERLVPAFLRVCTP